MKAEYGKPELFRLDNGLNVVLDPRAGAPVVSLQAWVLVGSADERPDQAGLAHIHEHMLFKGTPSRPVGRIAAEIEGAGGEINAFTSLDDTVYYITIASRFWDQALFVLADALINSSFDAQELERELEVIQEEILRGQDNPQIRLADLQFSTAYGTHPYGRSIIGTRDSVAATTRDKVIEFYERWYRPANVCLVISGDFDPASARPLIADAFSGWPAGRFEPRPQRPIEPAQSAPRAALERAPLAEAYLSLAWPITPMDHPDAAALDVAALILGTGESSRLYRSVKDRQELAYGVWAACYTPEDPGLLLAGAATTADKLRPCLAAILEQTARLSLDPPGADELAKAKKIVRAELIHEAETAQGAARKLGLSFALTRGLGFEERYLEQIERLTIDEVIRAAALYLRPERAVVAALWPAAAGNHPEADELAAICRTALEPGATPPPAQPSAASRRAPRQQRPRAQDGRAHYRELGSGLKLTALRRPGAGVFNLRAALLGGQRLERYERPGLLSFTTQLLTKGTASRDAEQLAREIDSLAGALSGFSGRNSSGLTGDFLVEDFERGLELFNDVLLRPRFDPAEIEKQRAETLFAISQRNDQPGRLVFDLFSRTLFGQHPYSFPMLGSAQSVSAFAAADLTAAWSGLLRPQRCVIGAVGDIEPERALDALERALEPAWPSAAQSFEPAPPPAALDGPRRAAERTDKEQAHVVVGFPGVTMYDPQHYAIELLSAVLGGQSGRLFLDLRDRQSLAYSLNALSVDGLDPGFFAVYIACAPDKVGRALEQIDLHLARLAAEPVDLDELERARRYVLGSFEIELQTSAAWASQLVLNELYGLPRNEIELMRRAIQSATPADLLAAARRLFDPQRRVQAVLSSEE